jgi:endonuclease YncB( thermonuclease family)
MRRRLAIAGAAALLLLASLWGLGRWLRPANDPDRYSVVEGDTLAWRPPQCMLSRLGIACIGERLRLYGVDAFEAKQTCRDARGAVWPCGAVATQRLHQLVESGDFACHVDHEFIDRHAREFAVCTAHGEDVGAVLVREGLAFAYGRGAQYLPFEAEAKAQRRGAWAGSFVRPQYFRERSDQ